MRKQYEELVKAIIAKETDAEELHDILEFIDERIMNMVNYVKAVCAHTIGVSHASVLMQSGILTRENYQNRVMTLDENRRSSHEVAMSSMDQLNRLCDAYGLAHMCPDDTDRVVRGDFCAHVTAELFMDGRGSHNMDEVVQRVEAGEVIREEMI